MQIGKLRAYHQIMIFASTTSLTLWYALWWVSLTISHLAAWSVVRSLRRSTLTLAGRTTILSGRSTWVLTLRSWWAARRSLGRSSIKLCRGALRRTLWVLARSLLQLRLRSWLRLFVVGLLSSLLAGLLSLGSEGGLSLLVSSLVNTILVSPFDVQPIVAKTFNIIWQLNTCLGLGLYFLDCLGSLLVKLLNFFLLFCFLGVDFVLYLDGGVQHFLFTLVTKCLQLTIKLLLEILCLLIKLFC